MSLNPTWEPRKHAGHETDARRRMRFRFLRLRVSVVLGSWLRECQMGRAVGRRLRAAAASEAVGRWLLLSDYVRRAGRGRRNPDCADAVGFALICLWTAIRSSS